MKQTLKILKYLLVYGLLLVGPATVVAIILTIVGAINGGTVNHDAVWDSPYMVPALAVGTLLNIIVFLWRRWAVIGLGRIRRDDLLMVCLMAVVLFLGWFFPEDLLQKLVEIPNSMTDKEMDQMTNGIAGIIDTGFLTPVAEELLCRGAILGVLLTMVPRRPWVAIVVSALIFGMLHLNPVQTVFGFLYGLLLGWLAWRTGSLLPGIVVHIANNASIMLMPESVEDSIDNMSLSAECVAAAVGLVVLVIGLRWFARKYRRIEKEISDEQS